MQQITIFISIYIALIMAFIVYICEEAKREAQYYYEKLTAGHIDSNYGEHTWFTVQRFCIFTFTLLAFIQVNGTMYGSILNFAVWMLFPFIHDYLYYKGRNDLDSNTYPGFTWKTQSKTSTAWMDRNGLSNPYTRLVLLIAGAITISVVLIIKIKELI